MLGKGASKKERALMLTRMAEAVEVWSKVHEALKKGFDNLAEELARVLEKETKRKKNRNKAEKEEVKMVRKVSRDD